jgi:PadR family transcriptional regulator, regulatory protein PadR
MSHDRELRKGSAEVLILSLLDERDRHGYELAKLIDRRSDGALKFHVASLYPTLYRLERRGLIQGRWVEKNGQRRKRFYRLTAGGQKMLASQRRSWSAFFAALNRVARIRPA